MKKIILLILPVLFLVVSCEDKQGKDCAGVEGGIASEDDCGMCTGGTTGVVANSSKDCAGVCDGTASQEDCDNCDSGTFDCSGTCDGSDVVDCEGVCGGSAVCGDDGGEELYSFNLNINDESGESISGVDFGFDMFRYG